MPGKRKAKGGGDGWRTSKPRHVHDSDLNVGMRGVLVTCDTHAEKGAVREGFSVLSQAWDLIAASREASAPAGDGDCGGEGSTAGGTGITDLAQEIAAEAAALNDERRFFVAQTGCQGFIVLRLNTTIPSSPNLLQLVDRVCESAATDGELGVRFIARMLPCQAVCRADLPKMVAAVRAAVAAERERLGASRCTSFAIQFKQRYNAKTLDRDEVIRVVADSAKLELPGATVSINDPALCIVLEVVKTFCCVCVVDRWLRNKRYSLRALQGLGDAQPAQLAPAAAAASPATAAPAASQAVDSAAAAPE